MGEWVRVDEEGVMVVVAVVIDGLVEKRGLLGEKFIVGWDGMGWDIGDVR